MMHPERLKYVHLEKQILCQTIYTKKFIVFLTISFQSFSVQRKKYSNKAYYCDENEMSSLKIRSK